jgi:hypothetical protein
MTDGGALPLPWSRLVRIMLREGLIDVTCTVGHAFGGQLEAVNVFSGLAAAVAVAKADAIIVAMGPGVAGTGTALGFSALEQGQVLNAATALDGNAIASLRLSFDSERARHRGLSHHSVTALTIGCQTRATVVVPKLESEWVEMLQAQLEKSGISERHSVVIADGSSGVRLLTDSGIEVESMGRSTRVAPEGILAAAAAGAVAADEIARRRSPG